MKKRSNVYRRLLSEMKASRFLMILTVICTVATIFANTLSPWFLGRCIDGIDTVVASGGQTPEEFWQDLFLMALCYGMNALFTLFTNFCVVQISQNTLQSLRERLNEKLAKLPVSYYDSASSGEILAVVTNDLENISNMLNSGLGQIVNSVISIAFVIVVMLMISPLLTVIGIATVPFLLLTGRILTKKSGAKFASQMAKTAELNGYVEEYYAGHNLVTLFGRKKTVNQGLSGLNDRLYKDAKEGFFLSGSMFYVSQFFSNIGYILVVAAGAVMAIAANLSVGMIQTFVQLLTRFSTPVNNLTTLTGTIQAGRAAAERVFHLLDEKEEVESDERIGSSEAFTGSVEFEKVSFGYREDQLLMRDLSFSVRPGEKLAIVGPTGAGKTTLVNLLMRFYDVNGGRILLDGKDTAEMKREDLRRMFGMVLQDTWLFQGTIRDNILYGRPEAKEEDVIRAAKAARAHDFIMKLPGEYDFVLSEGAENIAQGHRQLLTIARAMLSDPPIMILDEATSSVDTRTEVQIQEAMAAMMRGRTSFVIAHRLSTIIDSDRILYMENGTIEEIGSHQELMEKNGKYAKLYNSQFA